MSRSRLCDTTHFIITYLCLSFPEMGQNTLKKRQEPKVSRFRLLSFTTKMQKSFLKEKGLNITGHRMKIRLFQPCLRADNVNKPQRFYGFRLRRH